MIRLLIVLALALSLIIGCGGSSASSDAGPDAAPDAGPDATADAAPDASGDASADAGAPESNCDVFCANAVQHQAAANAACPEFAIEESLQDCLENCDLRHDAFLDRSAECATAHGDLNVCVEALGENDYVRWFCQDIADYACRDKDLSVAIDCVADTANCARFCDVEARCNGEAMGGCFDACVAIYNDEEHLSDQCAEALAALNGCVGPLTCQDYAAYQAETPGHACATELAALRNAEAPCSLSGGLQL